jgi:hypothetical protein
MAAKRRNPPGGSIKAGSDTRDARDDATIISWLQKIDASVLKGATKSPLTGKPAASAGGTFSIDLPNMKGLFGRLGDIFKGVGTSIIAAITKWFGNPNVAVPPENQKERRSVGQRVTNVMNNGGEVARRMGEGLFGTSATKEFSFQGLKAGVGVAPELRNGAPLARGEATRMLSSALAQSTMRGGHSALGTAGMGAAGFISTPMILPMVAALAGAGALAVGFAMLTPAVARFGEGLLNANRHLAEFSPSMAMVFAQKDIRDMMRGMQVGESTAGTASRLQTALGDFQDSLAPMVTMVRNIANLAGTFLLRAFEPLANLLGGIGTAVNKILEKMGLTEKSGEIISMSEWLDEVKKDFDRAKRNDDPHFRRARGIHDADFEMDTAGGDF